MKRPLGMLSQQIKRYLEWVLKGILKEKNSECKVDVNKIKNNLKYSSASSALIWRSLQRPKQETIFVCYCEILRALCLLCRVMFSPKLQ